MLNGYRRKRQPIATEVPRRVIDPNLRKFWSEKYRFCVITLQLNDEKAREWATRAVKIKAEIALNCLQ